MRRSNSRTRTLNRNVFRARRLPPARSAAIATKRRIQDFDYCELLDVDDNLLFDVTGAQLFVRC